MSDERRTTDYGLRTTDVTWTNARLIVEDDLTIAGFLMQGFKEAGFAVDHAADGETVLHLSTTEPYDVAVVDLMLPRLDGLTLIQRMRAEVRTPVLILSARHSVDDRVKGLQTGGDDYLTKPFAFPELLARVQALTPAGDWPRSRRS